MTPTRPIEPEELPLLPVEDETPARPDATPWRPVAPAVGLLSAALVLAAFLLG